jgi:hypothetical protein
MKAEMSGQAHAFDDLLFSFNKPAPAGLTDARKFLAGNSEAIILGLKSSKAHHRRKIQAISAAVFCILLSSALLFTFSAEARAFVGKVLYAVTEWFSPAENKSGVAFMFESGETPTAAPARNIAESWTEKIEFTSMDQARKIYGGKIFTPDDNAFSFTGGYIEDDALITNYTIGSAKIQFLQQPLPKSGSVRYHFNSPDFYKRDTGAGTFYYTFDNGRLFGGMLVSDKDITISSESLTDEQLDCLIRAFK